jgi:DNA-binding NarL/FixJ family response regulator
MARILIIEGGPHVREEMIRTLQLSPHQILLAATVSDGVCLAEQNAPDVVIITVPYLDQTGFSAIHRLARLFPQSHVVAITTTVTAVEYYRDTCISAFRLRADTLRAIQEVLALADYGFWSGDEETQWSTLAPHEHPRVRSE